VILAGGAGRRLGGVDKPGLAVAGRTLLDRAIDAVSDADPVIVVGPRRPTARAVRWTREDPPGSGPVAGMAAGIAALPTENAPGEDMPELVAVLAADLIGLRADTLDRLRAAVGPDVVGALLLDEEDHPQWLAGVWRLAALRAALPADPAGRSLRSVLAPLPVARLAARPGESADIDTPDDLAGAEAATGGRPRRAADASRKSHW
jgi:molybdopterin-guanine dinucleotide biosynthesis protein A